MSRKELQEKAKSLGIKANQSNETLEKLISEREELHKNEQVEEDVEILHGAIITSKQDSSDEDIVPKEKPEDLAEILKVEEPKEEVDNKPKYREQFVPANRLGDYIALGYKKSELKAESGFSVPSKVRISYRSAVISGELVYMTK